MTSLLRARRVVVLSAVALFVAAFVMTLPVGSVAAHSFLVATSPAQGQRLGGAPDSVVFVFSESVDSGSSEFVLRRAGGDEVEVERPVVSSDGLEIRVPVGGLGDGIYVVEWSAFSAVDGHGSAGEFAFSVGDVVGELPSAVDGSSTDLVTTVATWVFFVGLAAVMGSLLLRLSGSGFDLVRARRVGWWGVLTAGVAMTVVVIRSRVDTLTLLWCLQALLIALVVIRFERFRFATLGAVVVAGGLWSSRHHGASINGVFGSMVDTVHLLSATAWVGALALVVGSNWFDGNSDQWWVLVRRYSRVAIWLVLSTTVSGFVSAWTILPSWGSVTATGYGRLVSVKVVLLAVAVVLAVVARVELFPGRPGGRLRSSMSIEVSGLVGALVVATLLVGGVPPREVSAADELLGPEPLVGAVSHGAGLAGQLNVWIATDDQRLDVSISSPSGPIRGTTVELTAVSDDGVEVGLEPRTCGPGCFTTAVVWRDDHTILRVSAGAPDWVGGSWSTEIIRPPGRLAPDVLDDVLAQMRAEPSLQVTETVSSGPGSLAVPGTVTMGGDAFIATEPYAAGNVDDVRLVSGQPERLVLFLPGSQIYGEFELDDERRIRSSRLVTPGHEVLHEFTYDR